MLFPDKLDDYHNHHYQRYNLIKLLQLPPEQEGLYVAAGRFVRLANELMWPMNHLTAALNERNGKPIVYWRIGTRLGQKESVWPAMRDGGYIAIGWESLGDLSALTNQDDLKELIRKKLEVEYPKDPKTLSRKAGEIRNFVKRIEEGDVAVAADGQTLVGLGRVTGPYRYDTGEPAPHRRPVEWISTANWNMPAPDEGKLTTVFELGRHENNLLEIERQLLDVKASLASTPVAKTGSRPKRLEGIPGRIQAILDRKGQAILYGPPGTGTLRAAKSKSAFRAVG